MSKIPCNTDDVIDSRDVIERIEELQSEREALADELDDAAPEGKEKAQGILDTWDDRFGDELEALVALQDEAEGYSSDWKHGATLIRDSYFTEYAEELCKDTGDVPRDIPGYIVIDWEQTAENIKQDYTSVDFDGVGYWVR